MSLPTRAIYLDSDGNVIASTFVNVGWWLDVDGFVNACSKLPWIRDAVLVELYGVVFDAQLLKPVDENFSWKQRREALILAAPDIIKEFEQDSVELKQALREAYLKKYPK